MLRAGSEPGRTAHNLGKASAPSTIERPRLRAPRVGPVNVRAYGAAAVFLHAKGVFLIGLWAEVFPGRLNSNSIDLVCLVDVNLTLRLRESTFKYQIQLELVSGRNQPLVSHLIRVRVRVRVRVESAFKYPELLVHGITCVLVQCHPLIECL